jgi:general secretion pathway protein F
MRFELKGVDPANRVSALTLEAADEAAARELAAQRGLTVLSIRRRSLAVARTGGFPTTLFSIELLALLDAGLNVVEALQALAEKEPRGENRQVLAGILEALRRGESLSQAVAHFPRAFSPFYVATVKSSERTGNLRDALSRYVAYREELDRVRKKVASALIYPAILALAGALVLAFLLFYVVPRFARVYEDISTGLPFFSGLLLALGRWIEQNGVLALILLVSGGVGIVLAASRKEVRGKLLQLLWQIPSLGERMRIYQLARFYRTVGMLLRAGIPALRAFEMVAGVLSANLRASLALATRKLAEGQPISAALTAAGLATPVATRMMAVGERSGGMGETMERVARFYDDETARFVDAFTRVFDPVLMAVLGLAVGAVVVLMYMPIFELAGSLK